MATTPPGTIEAPHVHGMRSHDLPGFYNNTCGGASSTSCISQLNLVCVNNRCLCIESYIPDNSGGCDVDIITLLITWIVRLLVCASLFFICISLFHVICKRSMREQREAEAEEGRRDSTTSSCWYDDPPDYLEVAEESPPPTYMEAVKECESSGGATRHTEETAAPPQTVLSWREWERGEVEDPTTPSQPCPDSPDTAPPHTLHM